MITRTYINYDITKLKEVLEATGYFAAVEYDDESAPTSVTVRDADSNTLAVFTLNGITAYASAEFSQSVSFNTNVKARTAYACPNGVLIECHDGTPSGYQGHILISRTNRDTVAFVFSYASYAQGSRANAFRNYYAVTWGDAAPISAYTSLSTTAHNQTILAPFPTNSAAVHTQDAFYTLFGPYYTMDYLEFSLDGQNYFTNGYWAIRDTGVR